MRKTVQRSAVVLALVLGLSQTFPVLADELEERQRELDIIQEQMQEQANRSYEAQQQANSISAQLQGIQAELDKAEGELKTIQGKLDITEQQVKANTELLIKTEKTLTDRNLVLQKRIRDIYENGTVSYVEVLFGAKDFNDFTSRLELLRRVVAQDMALINQVKAEKQLIVEKKTQLEKDKAAIIAYKELAANERNIVETKRRERQNMLDNVLSQKEIAERAYAELEQDSRNIERMIQQMQNTGGSRARGSAVASGALMWPISGEITSPFGWRVHPVFGTQKFHTGIDIAADYGDAVVAADSGVVIHADWYGGYGKAVIIDHGNGVQTLYAHNSELLVSEGQAVRKGQVISHAGSTGYSTGPHVHFEVRRNGTPTDPLGYLP